MLALIDFLYFYLPDTSALQVEGAELSGALTPVEGQSWFQPTVIPEKDEHEDILRQVQVLTEEKRGMFQQTLDDRVRAKKQKLFASLPPCLTQKAAQKAAVLELWMK